MKMYILVKELVLPGIGIVSVAHASLAVYLKYQDRPEMKEWLDSSFRKVVCKVNDEEFERAKSVQDHVILTESKLDNQEISIAFLPRKEWPKMFQFLRLWK